MSEWIYDPKAGRCRKTDGGKTMSDKIEEIRARHSRDERWRNGPSMICPQAHDDRATLLAEVERLRAEIERLRNEADLTREALGGWALVPPDGGADPTHERVAAVVAEVERQREALVLGSEVLASHQGSPQREWHSGGAWLYPGDSINVVRAPLPEIKVEP